MPSLQPRKRALFDREAPEEAKSSGGDVVGILKTPEGRVVHVRNVTLHPPVLDDPYTPADIATQCRAMQVAETICIDYEDIMQFEDTEKVHIINAIAGIPGKSFKTTFHDITGELVIDRVS